MRLYDLFLFPSTLPYLPHGMLEGAVEHRTVGGFPVRGFQIATLAAHWSRSSTPSTHVSCSTKLKKGEATVGMVMFLVSNSLYTYIENPEAGFFWVTPRPLFMFPGLVDEKNLSSASM